MTALRGDEAHRKDEALFIQRGLELVIDLLAQLPTRRYAKMFVDDRLLLAQLRLLQSTLPPLTVKLVQMLKVRARRCGVCACVRAATLTRLCAVLRRV